MVTAAGTVVLDYCAAVKGILNDDQGGPLNRLVYGWPGRCGKYGSRWSEISKEKGDVLKANCGVWRGASIGD